MNIYIVRLLTFLIIGLFLQGCSDSAESPKVIQTYEAQGWQLLDESHGGDGSAYGLENCGQCHVMNQIHDDVPAIKTIVEDKGYGSCTGCHGDNGTESNRQCVLCHNQSDLPDHPLSLGEHGHGFSSLVSMNADQECIVCHEVSDMNGVFDRQVDLTRFTDENGEKQPYRNVSEFCLRCHNDNPQSDVVGLSPISLVTLSNSNSDDSTTLVAMKTHYDYLDWHGYPDGNGMRVYAGLRANAEAEKKYEYKTLVECTDCHEMHGTHNPSLFIASSEQGVSKLSAEFRQQGHSVTITNDDYSQLCVMCHVMDMDVEKSQVDTGNGLAGVHETGRECKSCHRHGMSTQVGL